MSSDIFNNQGDAFKKFKTDIEQHPWKLYEEFRKSMDKNWEESQRNFEKRRNESQKEFKKHLIIGVVAFVIIAIAITACGLKFGYDRRKKKQSSAAHHACKFVNKNV